MELNYFSHNKRQNAVMEAKRTGLEEKNKNDNTKGEKWVCLFGCITIVVHRTSYNVLDIQCCRRPLLL